MNAKVWSVFITRVFMKDVLDHACTVFFPIFYVCFSNVGFRAIMIHVQPYKEHLIYVALACKSCGELYSSKF